MLSVCSHTHGGMRDVLTAAHAAAVLLEACLQQDSLFTLCNCGDSLKHLVCVCVATLALLLQPGCYPACSPPLAQRSLSMCGCPAWQFISWPHTVPLALQAAAAARALFTPRLPASCGEQCDCRLWPNPGGAAALHVLFVAPVQTHTPLTAHTLWADCGWLGRRPGPFWPEHPLRVGVVQL